MLVGGISEVLTAWIDGRIDADRQTLVADVTELFVALLDAASRIAARRADGAAR